MTVYEKAKFGMIRHNLGNAFSLEESRFVAPMTGMYEFQLKLHNGDKHGNNRTCAALATAEDSLEYSRIAEVRVPAGVVPHDPF